jgi:hypothetical protein
VSIFAFHQTTHGTFQIHIELYTLSCCFNYYTLPEIRTQPNGIGFYLILFENCINIQHFVPWLCILLNNYSNIFSHILFGWTKSNKPSEQFKLFSNFGVFLSVYLCTLIFIIFILIVNSDCLFKTALKKLQFNFTAIFKQDAMSVKRESQRI